MERPNLPTSPRQPQSPDATPPRGGRLLSAHSREEEQLLEPRRLIESVKRRKWSMLAVFTAVMVVGAYLVLTRPISYHSYATFLIEEPTRGTGGSPALSMLDRLGRSNTIDTEIELLGSRRVLGPVVERLSLHVSVHDEGGYLRPADVFSPFRADRDAVPGSYSVAPRSGGGFVITETESGRVVAEGGSGEEVTFAGLTLRVTDAVATRRPVIEVYPFAAAVQSVRGSIAAHAVAPDASVIQLTCGAATAVAAEEMCSAISDTYLDLRSELQRAQATAAEQFLSEQVERIEQRLVTAEDSLKEYARRHQVVALQAQAEGEVGRYAEIRARSELMQSELEALQRLMSAIGSEDADSREYRNLASFPTFMTGQNRFVTGLVERLVELENQRSELALRRTDTNPDMVAIDNRIREIEGQLKSTTEGYARALESQISSLQGVLGSMSSGLARIPEQQVESARLERQVSLLEDLYRFLQTRLREAEVAQAVNMPSVRIIDEASYPTSPTQQSRRLGIGLALLAGLAAAFLTGIVQEYMDTRLREPQDVERRTGIPVLSVVPRLKMQLGANVLRRNGAPVKTPQIAGNGQEQEAAVEAFRSLVLELRFAGERLRDGNLRLVAVTSAARGEGKTFTACNLALTSALQGTRTLLIDADLRALGASRLMGLAGSEVGLGDVLEGRVDAGEAVHEFEVGSGVLHVLPGGKHQLMSSAALLASDRLAEVVTSFREEFELVIVDTPPLNLISDAATVSSHVDGVLLVVRGGFTQREALEVTLNRLERARAFIAGIVVNDVHVPDYYYTPYGK